MENIENNQSIEKSLDAIIAESKTTIAASDSQDTPKKRGRPRKDAAANEAPKNIDTLAAFPKPAGLAPIFMMAADLPVTSIRSKFQLTSHELPSLDLDTKKIVGDQLDIVAGLWLPQGGEANKYVQTVTCLAVVGMVYGQVYMNARDIALAKLEASKNDK